MTDLFLGEESKQYKDLARDFFRNEIASKSEKLDHEGRFPLDLYKAAWELGLATSFIPETYGGLGLSLWDSTVMAEEAGAASGGFAAAFEGNALACAALIVAGSDSQKTDYLSQLCNAATLASYCFPAGADGGSFPSAAVKVNRKGKGFELNGPGVIALNGENAAWYFVLAQDDEAKNSSAFVIPANHAGITRGAQIHKLGRCCADICTINFNNLELGTEYLVGKEGEGLNVVLESSSLSAAIVAAHATGLMQSGLEHSIRYSHERQTFGKPLSKHQALGFMLADMAKNVECARLMTWKAASLFDAGLHDYIQSLSAKTFAIDAAMSSATDAVQVYGGYGYSKEYPVERLMRDAKMMQMMAGSSFEVKCRIGEELLTMR